MNELESRLIQLGLRLKELGKKNSLIDKSETNRLISKGFDAGVDYAVDCFLKELSKQERRV